MSVPLSGVHRSDPELDKSAPATGARAPAVAGRTHRRRLIVVVVITVIASLLGLRATRGPEVPVITASRADLVQTVVASGHVEAPHRVSIGSQVTGMVRQVPVAEGQQVTAGQALILLDDAELKAAASQAARAAEQAIAQVRQISELREPVARQAYLQAQVSADNARRQWHRQRELFMQRFIGEAALDDARKAADLADAQVVAAREQWRSVRPEGSDATLAEAGLSQANAISEAARARWRYALIAAPADGVLISRDVEPGDVVQPGKVLMVLSPAGQTQLVVQIDEKNLALLRDGQSALASADAYPAQRFHAVLVYINPGVDAQSGAVQVKLQVPQPPAYLLQDMTVSVDIEVARRPQAVVVSATAIHEDPVGGPWVLVAEDGRARRRSVHLGLRSAGLVEVISGLVPGERLVPASDNRIKAGSALRPVDPS